MKKASAKTKPCDCIEQVNKKLEPTGYKLDTKMQFDFDAKKASLCITLPVRKIDGKSRKKPPSVTGGFCPFCGKETQ